MPYLFCLIIDFLNIAACVILGFFVWTGATLWLVPVMLVLSLMLIIPSQDTFRCPKCGHLDKVKTFHSFTKISGVQNGQESADSKKNSQGDTHDQ